MTERPAQQSSDWDPTVADPLYVGDYGEQLIDKGGYTDPPTRRTLIAWVFIPFVVVLAILAAALLVAAPKTEGSTDVHRPERVSGVATTGGGRRAHLGIQAGRQVDADREALQRPRLGDSVGVLPDTSTSVSGTASWFCGGGSACTRGYPPGTLAAAAGPALRVGDWRGRIVKVCSGGRCVKVQLVDWCACPRRVIDLYRSAFSRLANPSRGLLRVSITWGGSTVVLPPTDTR